MAHAKRCLTRGAGKSNARGLGSRALRTPAYGTAPFDDERYKIVEPPEVDDEYLDAESEAGIAGAIRDPYTEH
jgi:hypothetical protein